jgi:hypothetical protein
MYDLRGKAPEPSHPWWCSETRSRLPHHITAGIASGSRPARPRRRRRARRRRPSSICLLARQLVYYSGRVNYYAVWRSAASRILMIAAAPRRAPARIPLCRKTQ